MDTMGRPTLHGDYSDDDAQVSTLQLSILYEIRRPAPSSPTHPQLEFLSLALVRLSTEFYYSMLAGIENRQQIPGDASGFEYCLDSVSALLGACPTSPEHLRRPAIHVDS